MVAYKGIAVGMEVELQSDHPPTSVSPFGETQELRRWRVAGLTEESGTVYAELEATVMCPSTSADQAMGNGRCPEYITRHHRVAL